jgi:hypothetical protein
VHVSAVCDHVADVYPNAKPDAALGGSIAVVHRHLLLHFHCAPHRSLDAIEHHEHRVTRGVRDPPAMLGNSRVNQIVSECPHPLQRPGIIRPDEPAIADDVGINDHDELPPAGCPASLRGA